MLGLKSIHVIKRGSRKRNSHWSKMTVTLGSIQYVFAIIQTTSITLVALRLHKSLRYDVLSDIETGPWNLTQFCSVSISLYDIDRGWRCNWQRSISSSEMARITKLCAELCVECLAEVETRYKDLWPLKHGLTLIPAWMSNHMPSKVWDELLIHS